MPVAGEDSASGWLGSGRFDSKLPLPRLACGYTLTAMTTSLQAWGNSQGIRIPKALLRELKLDVGASLELVLSPKKDAIVVRLVKPKESVRGRLRIEDLADAMPKDYESTEFGWDSVGKEVW